MANGPLMQVATRGSKFLALYKIVNIIEAVTTTIIGN